MWYKKQIGQYKYYLLTIVLSCLPLASVFGTSELLHTHDGLVHLPRMASYFKALKDGQFPVRFAGDLNYGYGVPLFVFIYQLPYFFSSIFLFLGSSLVNAFKIVLSLSYIFSGIFMLAWANEFFKDKKKAALAAIFYQFAPFRLVELLTRGSFGEVYTYTFLPLALLGLVRLFKKMNFGNFLLTATATAFLILSHNSVSLLFFGVAVVFVIFFAKHGKQNQAFYSIKSLVFSLLALTVGLVLSAFYWLPALLEHKYTYGNLFMEKVYLDHFPPLIKFFIPNLTNSDFFQIEGISVQLGIFHVAAIFISSYVLFIKKTLDSLNKRIFIFAFLLLTFSFFFLQPVSIPIWEKVSFLRQFQFPWRFLSVSVFAASLLSVSFFEFKWFNKSGIYWLVLFSVVFSTIFYWRPALGYDRVDEDYYWNYPLNTTYYGETDVIWSAGPAGSYPVNPVEVIEGEARVYNFVKKSNLHIFTVEASTNSKLVDHTQYFPGWRVFVDNEKTPIEFQDINWRGQITFPVSQGVHNVRVVFGESKTRMTADLISLGSLTALALCHLGRRVRLFEKFGGLKQI